MTVSQLDNLFLFPGINTKDITQETVNFRNEFKGFFPSKHFFDNKKKHQEGHKICQTLWRLLVNKEAAGIRFCLFENEFKVKAV